MFTLLKTSWKAWRHRQDVRKNSIDWTQSIEAIQTHIASLQSGSYSEEDWIEMSSGDGISTSAYVETPEEHIILARALREGTISVEALTHDEDVFLEGRPVSMTLMNTLIRAHCVDWDTVFAKDRGHFFLGRYRVFFVDEIPNSPLLDYYLMTHQDVTTLLRRRGDVDAFTLLKIAKHREKHFDPLLCREREFFYRDPSIPYGFHGGVIAQKEDFMQAMRNMMELTTWNIPIWYRAPYLEDIDNHGGFHHPSFKILFADKFKDIHAALQQNPNWLPDSYPLLHALIEIVMNAVPNIPGFELEKILIPLQGYLTGKHYDILRREFPGLCHQLLGEQYDTFCRMSDIYAMDNQRPFLSNTLEHAQETTIHW